MKFFLRSKNKEDSKRNKMTFHRFSKFPFEIRQQVRHHAIQDRSHHLTTLHRYMPTGSRQDSVSHLAVVNEEWQSDVERYTFQILHLQLGNKSLQHLDTFSRIMNNKRVHYLKVLKIDFDYHQALDEEEAPRVFDLTIERLSELLAVLRRMDGLRIDTKSHNVALRLSPMTFDGSAIIYTTITGLLTSNDHEFTTRLNSVMRETPEVSAVRFLDVSSDFLPPSVMALLIGRFPKLQHIGLTSQFDTTNDPDVWERGSKFFGTALPSCTPPITSFSFTRVDPSTHGPVNGQQKRWLMPDMKDVDLFIRDFRKFTSKVQVVYLNDMTTSTAFCTRFFSRPGQPSVAPAAAYQWPSLRKIHIDIPRSADVVRSRKNCVALFTAAGRAAAEMPVLEHMTIRIDSTGQPLKRSAKLEFKINRVEDLCSGDRFEKTQQATLVFRGLVEVDPGMTAAWDYVENTRGLKFHTEWHFEEKEASSDGEEGSSDDDEGPSVPSLMEQILLLNLDDDDDDNNDDDEEEEEEPSSNNI